MSTHHGQYELRGTNAPCSKYYNQGRFGRLFPNLPELPGDTLQLEAAMREIGKVGGIMDAGAANPDNPSLPAGFTFLGQFLDHDVTFDPTSSLERQNDPEAVQNFRTPLLELDSLYGSGPAASPHLYDTTDRAKLLLDAGHTHDLPRNSLGTALIGDPRNDENVIVSQLHLALLKAHNKAVDLVRASGVPERNVFAEAQRLTRWHYQWVVVHEFLPRTCGNDVMKDVLDDSVGRCFYDWRHEPFIPVEFAVAAYRFGHSQVRPGYRINANFAAGLFNPPGGAAANDLSGGKRLDPARVIDWKGFFAGGAQPPQAGKLIDSKLSTPLLQLPFIPPPENSLASRNLIRGLRFSLPSGQSVARAMRIKKCWKHVPFSQTDVLSDADLADLKAASPAGLRLDRHTPLWLYILREAHVREGGKHLGPIGGRIVAEVFIGLLDGDRFSYRRSEPDWQPEFPKQGNAFGMDDLLRFAGV